MAGFLAFYVGVAILTSRQQKLHLSGIQQGKRAKFLPFLISLGQIVLMFGMFWALTGFFSYRLIVLIAALLLLNVVVYQLIGAISGFTLEENIQKINALSIILAAEQRTLSCLYLAASSLSDLIAAVGAVVIFWMYPTGHPTAVMLIAVALFAVPQVVQIPAAIVATWPIITSEYIDNDLRDSYLVKSFAGLFLNAVYLLFPLWLLAGPAQQFFQSRHLAAPQPAVILVIPILVFLLGAVVPFFIGTYRRRAEAQRMWSWQEEWLAQFAQALKLPPGPRESEVEQCLTRLREEIVRRFSRNSLFQMYEEVVLPELPAAQRPIAGMLTADDAEEQPVPAVQPSDKAGVLQAIRVAKERLRSPMSPPAYQVASLNTVREILAANAPRLVDWDLRFANLWRLLQFYEITLQADPAGLAPYVTSALKDAREAVKSARQRRSVIAAALLTMLSSSVVWVVKTYGSEILKAISAIVLK